MNETTLLNGRVLKRSLPVIQGRPDSDAPRLKRMLLPQGELAQVYDAEPGIRYLAYIELREGAIRGNHFHKVKNEFIYIITGRILLAVADPETKDSASMELQSGDLAFVPVNIAHAFRTIQGGHGVEFSVAPFDLEDIFRYPLLS
jgi:quercetin dioxygenase-like cupin family protein